MTITTSFRSDDEGICKLQKKSDAKLHTENDFTIFE